MNLKNKFIVTAVHGKTKTRVFKDTKVGDVLEMTVPISSASGGGTVYATYIGVNNLSQDADKGSSFSFTELSKVLRQFVTLEEVPVHV